MERDCSFLLGSFSVDVRLAAICDKLQEYYDSTPPEVGNKEVMVKWREFRLWCDDNGYSASDVSRAKRARCYRVE